MQQRTIQHAVSLEGIGLHSGQSVVVEMLPAQEDTGIVFLRTDLADAQPIPATYQAVSNTLLSSNLTNQLNQQVGTVEHLMSAIAALGIDNLLVKVSAAEVPILDGSAYVFIEQLLDAGIAEQTQPKRFIQILRPVSVNEGDKWAKIQPYDGFSLDIEIAFNHPVFQQKTQRFRSDFNRQSFTNDIATARTFGFLKDIEQLQSQKLALGGSLKNAVVLDDTGVINPEGLRFDDEFVRHKILDAVGDLYLAGHQLLGAFSAYKSGHKLNNELLRAIFSDEQNFKVVTKYDIGEVRIVY